MTKFFKSTILVVAGLCWLAVAVTICIFLFSYLAGGAGLPGFGASAPVSSTSVSFGLIQFVGFAAAACVCFVIGVGLFAHGVTPPQGQRRQPDNRS